MALGVPYGSGLLFVSKIDYQFSGGKHFVLITYTSSAQSKGLKGSKDGVNGLLL